MAIAYDTLPEILPQVTNDENVDLLLRYCPGLAEHAAVHLARYITVDSTQCWLWPDVTESGYGWISLEATPYGYTQVLTTHRYMYDILVGDVPRGYHIHHTCLNKPCWNPFHLQEVTPKEHQAKHRHLRLVPKPWQPPVQLALTFG